MRSKVSTSILLSDLSAVAAGAEVEVLRTGAVINESDTIGAANLTVDVYQPGDLAANDVVQVLSGSTLHSTLFKIASIAGPNGGAGGDWTITFNVVTGDDVEVSDGDALVLQAGVANHRITLYSDDTGSGTLTNPITVPADGMIEFWTSLNDVDLYVSGSGVTTTYWRDIQAGGPNIKHNLSASTAPDADTGDTDGYSAGSIWVDTTADKAYICLDPTDGTAVWTEITDDTDDTAIHTDGASEISGLSSKASPAANDVFIIEDSADSYAKKKVLVSNLPAGSETNNLEDACTGIAAGELLVGASADTGQYVKISALTEEESPTTGDWLLCEESGGNVRKVDIGDLPAGSETNSLETTCTGIAEGEVIVGAAGGDAVTYAKISTLSEETTPAAGDWLLGEESGGAVRKFDVGDLPYPVTSVFSRTGAVVAASNDYTWAQIDKTTSDVADLTTKSHTSLTDIGSTTHAQIDTHVGAANPHSGSAASGANSDITSLAGLTTPLSETQGGTGQSTITAGDLLYGDGANSLGKLAKGTEVQFLRMNTGATAPEWVTPYKTFSVCVEDPALNDLIGLHVVDHNLTVLKIEGICEGGTSVAASFEYAATITASGTVIGTLTPTTSLTSSGALDVDVADGQVISVNFTAVTGTVNQVLFTVTYRENA